jgi:hypothetical protein
MKKIIIITTLMFFSINAKSQCGLPTSDTLQWLKTHIEQKNSYFHNKPFKTLMDSLCGMQKKMSSYFGPDIYDLRGRDSLVGDTIFTDNLTIGFGNWLMYDAYKKEDSAFWASKNSGLPYTYKMHIPIINIKFINTVPIPLSIVNDRVQGLYWSRNLANKLRTYLIDSVTIDEF